MAIAGGGVVFLLMQEQLRRDREAREQAEREAMAKPHDHTWTRTNHYHPTTEPIYFYTCGCGAFTKGKHAPEPQTYGIMGEVHEVDPGA